MMEIKKTHYKDIPKIQISHEGYGGKINSMKITKEELEKINQFSKKEMNW